MPDDVLYSRGDEGALEGDGVPEDGAPARGVIVNNEKLGRWIRGVRVSGGITNDSLFSAAVKRMTTLTVNPRVLYNIQTGRRGPTLEEAVALVYALKLKGGLHTLLDAFDPEIAKGVRKLDAQYVESEPE